MCDSQDNKYRYVSLIKMNGKPILPPVITPDLRKELLHYKQQAIKLEKRIKTCRELKRNLEELQNSCALPSSKLTFGDTSHIEGLDISNKFKSPIKLKNIHLHKDLIEVTQYNERGSELICFNEKLHNNNTFNSEDESNKTLCDSPINSDCLRPRSSSESRQDSSQQTPHTSPKTRLIRSNSYTLDAPSPILLEHLKRTANGQANYDADDQWVLSQSNCNSVDFSMLNPVFNKCNEPDSPDNSSKDIEELLSPTIEVNQSSNQCETSAQEILFNSININDNGTDKKEKYDVFFTKVPLDSPLGKSTSFWENIILKEIPDVYAKQVIELLKNQHLERKETIKQYENKWEEAESGKDSGVIKNKHSSSNNEIDFSIISEEDGIILNKKKSILTSCSPNPATKDPEDFENLIDFSSLSEFNLRCDLAPPIKSQTRPNTLEHTNELPNINTNEKLTRSNTFSMSPSQSIYYSVSSDSDTVRRLTPALNLTVKDQEELEIGILREKEEYWEAVVVDAPKYVSCSRELFPELDSVTIQALKRDWAASVIGAHVRGYLTRRLIKTEKVQILIATVKDVLMCALELHHSETIDEKDVELHRRLINQLSAALYSFHDIFFELPIAEQMSIVRADRQRKLEKLKRPQSGQKSAWKTLNSSRSDKSAVTIISSNRSSNKISGIQESPKVAKV